MGYFIFLFSVESDLCRYFFQNVKKTDCGGKNDIWGKWRVGLFAFSNLPGIYLYSFNNMKNYLRTEPFVFYN